MSKAARIQHDKENAEANIELMATWPHKKLAERLELVNIQSEMAEKKKNKEAFDLLEVWRSQLIEARILKYENNIPDALDEIQEAIADIETVKARQEERKEIIEEVYSPRRRPPPDKTSEQVQLPLF
jgi:hypothetical protein